MKCCAARLNGALDPHIARVSQALAHLPGVLALLASRLGVVLHFLCTGMSLFHMDVDDNVTPGGPEEAKLRAWEGIDAEHLGGVFAKAKAGELEDADIAAAQDLLRWCLERNPADRPQSMVQVAMRAAQTSSADSLCLCSVPQA